MKKRMFQRKSLHHAVVAMIAAGVIAAPNAFAGTPDPNATLPLMFALEDAEPIAIPGGQTIAFPVGIDYEMGITRSTGDDFYVRYTLPPNTKFVVHPTLTVVQGNGASPPVDTDCNRQNFGMGENTVEFQCTPNFGNPISEVVAGNFLRLGNVIISTTDKLCDPSYLVDLKIQLGDGSSTINPIDDSPPGGFMFGGLYQMKPASALFASGAPTMGAPDAGATTANVFAFGGPLTGFIPDFKPGYLSGPFDTVTEAKANYKLNTTTPGVLDLDGTMDYVLLSTDIVMLNISDDAKQFQALQSLCVDPEAAPGACASVDKTFFPVGSTATLTGPGTSASFGAVKDVVYTVDGTMIGEARLLGMSGKVTGHKGCVVNYTSYPNWWPWGSNGTILTAHNVEKPVGAEVHKYTLTNHCPYEVPYWAYVGNGAGANAVSCGNPAAPAFLKCEGTIPAANGFGQPGNRTRSVAEITNASAHLDMTADFLVGAPPRCVLGEYEEQENPAGSNAKTIMEKRDFMLYDQNLAPFPIP